MEQPINRCASGKFLSLVPSSCFHEGSKTRFKSTTLEMLLGSQKFGLADGAKAHEYGLVRLRHG
jgi:hypothetical protein